MNKSKPKSLRLDLGIDDYAKLQAIARRPHPDRPTTNARMLGLYIIRQFIEQNHTPKD